MYNAIGIKSEKVLGLSFFGMSAMKVEFRDPEIKPSLPESSITSNNSLPVMSKKVIKSYAVQLSGPGILSLAKLERTFF